jgi:hypothetical protein
VVDFKVLPRAADPASEAEIVDEMMLVLAELSGLGALKVLGVENVLMQGICLLVGGSGGLRHAGSP